MGHPDDYKDEMERLSSQEAEEVLSGKRPTTGAARGAAAVVDRLRTELLSQPSAGAQERHLLEMRAAAGSDESRRDPMRTTKTRKGVASLGLAAALVLGASLAGALTLPEQASDVAKQRIEELQPPVGPGNGGQDAAEAEDASDHGKAVSAAAHDDATEGCEHGRAVSGIASSKADDNRNNSGDHPGECGPNGGNGAAASAAKANNGNHGQGNNGNHGDGNNGNGPASAGNRGQSSDAGTADASDNGKNELPHGIDTAPGQAKDHTAETDATSETGSVTDDLPPEA